MTRTRPSARCTVPSRSEVTPSSPAMSRAEPRAPAIENEDVRDATWSPGRRERLVRISSLTPWLKKSCAGSPVTFSNGRTATDRSSAGTSRVR